MSQNQLISAYAQEPEVKNLQLLTAKKQLYFLNGNETDVSPELTEKIKAQGGDYLAANLAVANETLSVLIRKTYIILNLISFFTTGADESRAWTIENGWRAPQAAGVIHTDFEKKFIRAEVVQWQKLLEAGSWVNSKARGWLRLEGKEYIVQDGDVLVIRHS